MNELLLHEQFEIEVLDFMKSARLLDPLVFGGGTMLRLCHDLNRYSVDLDFWFIKPTDAKAYYRKARQQFAREYELTDASIKYYTVLFELRIGRYPKRLKIEIRKEASACDFQEGIAFSSGSSRQVSLQVHTLEEAMKRKVRAALDRKVIRDFFDIEFLLRRGIDLNIDSHEAEQLKTIIQKFKIRDFKVTLGSFLDPETRSYYISNQFAYLVSKLNVIESSPDQ